MINGSPRSPYRKALPQNKAPKADGCRRTLGLNVLRPEGTGGDSDPRREVEGRGYAEAILRVVESHDITELVFPGVNTFQIAIGQGSKTPYWLKAIQIRY